MALLRPHAQGEKDLAETFGVDIARIKAACARLARADLLVDAGYEGPELGVFWEPKPCDLDGLRKAAAAKGYNLSESL